MREINVKNHIRKTKGKSGYKLSNIKGFKRKGKDKQNILNNNAVKTTAGVLGLSSLAYIGLRGRYRGMMKNTLTSAIKKSNSIKLPNLDKDTVVLSFAGFVGTASSKSSTKKFGNLIQQTLPDTNVIPISNKSFTPLNPYQKKQNPKEWATRSIYAIPELLTKTAIKGKNQGVEDILSHAIAINKQYPNKQIVMTANSGGGFAVQEASEHLTKLGIKHKFVTIGSPYYGFSKPSKNSIGIVNPKDPLTNLSPVFNRTIVKDTTGHFLDDYFKSNQMKKIIKDFISKPTKTSK